MTTAPDRPDLLVLQRIADPGMALIEGHFAAHHLWQADDPDALLAAAAPRVRAVLTGAHRGIAPALVERLPALEIVSLHGVGLDAVDLDHARRRGLRVAYTPEVLTEDVADMAMGLLLAACRRLAVADRFVRSGAWGEGQTLPLSRRVSGMRLGILGMGRIGSAVARRAEAFGMEIAYTNRRRRDDSPYRHEPDLKALAAWCDVLVVAASVTPGGPPLVDAAVLEALGPRGFLVNVGRGALIDEPALIDALRGRRLAGAGLDVFTAEPQVPEALRGLDSVVLAPHHASATEETRAAMAVECVQHLIDHFAGRTPAHLAA